MERGRARACRRDHPRDRVSAEPPPLRDLGALDAYGAPQHLGGISITHLGLVYVGLENQRSFASSTLRGVSADAAAVIAPLVAWIRAAPAAVGITEVERTPLTTVN